MFAQYKKTKYVEKTNRLEKFRASFYTLNSRYPTKEEIKQNQKYIKEDDESSDAGRDSDNTDELENCSSNSGLSNYTDDILEHMDDDLDNEVITNVDNVDMSNVGGETFL